MATNGSLSEKIEDISEKTNNEQEKNIKKPELINNDELDTLPDMGSFESSFSHIGNSGSGSKTIKDEHEPKITSMKNNENDPATYAKAVRTIMNKDKEGSKKYGR